MSTDTTTNTTIIHIKSRWGKILYESTKTTVRDAVGDAVRERVALSGAILSDANLSDANLREANLRWADLSGADLSGADLRGADLREANLSGADLRGADLSDANLNRAELDTPIISLSGIGSARRMTTYHVAEDKIWCGCFVGTIQDFRAAVEKTHASDPVYLGEYRAAIAYLEAIRALHTEVRRARA